MKAVSARLLAVQTVRDVLDGSAFLQDRVNEALAENPLPPADKRFLQRLARGTVEHRLLLDWYIGQVSSVPVRKMKPLIRAILRVTAEQIFFLDVPDRASVSEAAGLARTLGFAGLSGFVNAVSRALADKKDSLLPPQDEQTRYSVPAWILSEYRCCAGKERTGRSLAYLTDASRHGITVHLHEDLLPAEDILARMEEDGLRPSPVTGVPGAVRVQAPDGLASCPSFAEGLFTVQDAGSIAACLAAGIKPGDTVLDLCAAPGGKSIFAAHAAGPEGSVTARDLTRAKTDKIDENKIRCRVPYLRTEAKDATEYDASFEKKADVVIADLPCSGLGDIARKPDIRYRQTPESVSELTNLQQKILANAVRYVRPGGALLYATCTVTEAENAGNVKWLTEQYPEFRAETLDVAGLILPEGAVTPYGVQLLPGELGGDGFFFARLVREEA